MVVDTYQSKADSKKYLTVPAGTDMSKLSVADLDPDYGELVLAQGGINLEPTHSASGLVNATILQDIAEHGFSVHLAPS